jgi:hypothetical protein
LARTLVARTTQENEGSLSHFADFHAQPENDGIKAWHVLTNDLSRKMEAEHLVDLRTNFQPEEPTQALINRR